MPLSVIHLSMTNTQHVKHRRLFITALKNWERPGMPNAGMPNMLNAWNAELSLMLNG